MVELYLKIINEIVLFTTEKERQQVIADDIQNKIQRLKNYDNTYLYFITITDTKYKTTGQFRFALTTLFNKIHKNIYFNKSNSYLFILEYPEIVSRGNFENIKNIDIHSHIILATEMKEEVLKSILYKAFIGADIDVKNYYKSGDGYLIKQKNIIDKTNYHYCLTK
ncbi:hypothetical protein [Flavobacterium gilvum]|uniref:Uncharacterized protein n=1 Tax=Flavobacterium gilvum TaxID=1492737 RepID=A0AAC9I211_9FLAO|nr:hypothetical protein [Flavobacterium gilvum]AOW08435.1 hypothetical protein EM308_02365 [Flavobacterium gilvum]KFC58783.1 hypothetical protein FEM08_24450 [Flavobacterium gilvum]